MTAYHLDHNDEIEAAKQWWSRYGRWLALLLVVGFAGFFAWKGWMYYQGRQNLKASALYSLIQADVAKGAGGGNAWQSSARALINQYSHTPYATLAAFMLAKNAVINGHLNEADTRLRWVMEHGAQRNLREIARIRLARILIDQKRDNEALKLLSSGFGEAYLPLTQELIGDALLAKGEPVKARDAYEEALAGAQAMGLPQNTLEMKIHALPAPTAQGGK